MPYEQQKRNKPIASLIKWYIDKKSGKVSESRKEIQKRFDYLDWKDQKRILLVFLQSCKSDREWAYQKVYRLWDNCFLEPMKILWEQYHENVCAWSVIEHFPIEYVKENAAKLEEINGYYHICQRLAENPAYSIDRNRLQDKEYLLVMLHTHRDVSENDARDIFFRSLHKICLTEPEYIFRVSHNSRGGSFSVEDIDDLNSLLWLFHLLGLEDLRESIWKWNQDVMSAIYQSEEMKELNKESISDEDYNQKRLAIGLKYLYIALDKKYKDPTDKTYIDQLFEKVSKQSVKTDVIKTQEPIPVTPSIEQREEAIAMLEQMKKKNSAIAKLVNSMGLDSGTDNTSEELPF